MPRRASEAAIDIQRTARATRGDGSHREPSSGGESRGASVILTVIQVLRCFTTEEPLQGVTEIAAKVGLHKSSVSRLLATLEQEEIVERDETSRKYRLGLGLISVAGPLLANLDVRRVCLPTLQSLAASSGETTALVVWSGAEAVTVEQVASAQQVKHTNPLGTRYGTALSASVQVFLAEMSTETARHQLERGMPPTPAGVDIDSYLQRLAECARNGYAVNYGEASPEEVGIAAAVRDHRGEVVGAVLLAAPLYRTSQDLVPELAAACVSAAAAISSRLGAPNRRGPQAAPTS